MTEKHLNNKKIMVDYNVTCDLFKQIKDKGINTKVDITKMDKPNIQLLESKDLIDKIHYYRLKNKVTKIEMAKFAGIDAETYSNYEKKKIPLINGKYIEKLNIKDKVEISGFDKFVIEYPLTKIVKIIVSEHITIAEFCRRSEIGREAVCRWIKRKGNIKINYNMFKKLYIYWKKYKNYD